MTIIRLSYDKSQLQIQYKKIVDEVQSKKDKANSRKSSNPEFSSQKIDRKNLNDKEK
jgi:hypothetical protein